MIRSGGKITVDETDEGLFVTIYPQIKTWQRAALVGWMVIWLISGLLFIMSAATSEMPSKSMVIIIFFAFWVYFLYYAARALIWHQTGREYLRLGSETLDYKLSWGGYGRARNFDWSTMRNPAPVDLSDNTFARAYQDAFWTVGGETIGFDYLGRKIVLARKVSDNDARFLLKKIREHARKAAEPKKKS